MVKLIACDIDGTMLLNGNKTVPAELIESIEKLVDMGVIFAPASGRQYPTMKRMFGNVADKLMYICENGALVVYKGKVLSKTIMDRDIALDIVEDILATPNCEVLLSGKDISYLKPKTRDYFDRIHNRIKNNICLPNDFRKIDDEFIKVAACDVTGIVNSKDHFIEKWSDKVATVVSGDLYIDFNVEGVNKGKALCNVMKELGISKDETMAFGDSYNDLEMLKSVKYSYAMEGAMDDIKAASMAVTDNVNTILKKLIDGGKL